MIMAKISHTIVQYRQAGKKGKKKEKKRKEKKRRSEKRMIDKEPQTHLTIPSEEPVAMIVPAKQLNTHTHTHTHRYSLDYDINHMHTQTHACTHLRRGSVMA